MLPVQREVGPLVEGAIDGPPDRHGVTRRAVAAQLSLVGVVVTARAVRRGKTGEPDGRPRPGRRRCRPGPKGSQATTSRSITATMNTIEALYLL